MKYVSHSILLLSFLSLLSISAFACTCLPTCNFEKEVEEIDTIFVGKVIEVVENENYVSREANGAKKFFITLKVKQNIKGATQKEITIIQYKYKKDMPCSSFIHFKKKKNYLISANKTNDNEIKVNRFCLRTQRFDKNSDRYKQLIKLKQTKPNL
jgi:hypothetical protein